MKNMKNRLVPPEIVVILAGVTAALHLGKLPPAIPVLEQALGITLVQAGFLLSLVQLAGMTVGLLVGVFADSLGLRRSMLAGLSVLAAASALGGFVQTATALLWLRGLEGVGFLLVVLPAPALVRRLVPPQLLSRRLGLWGCYMGIGTGLALLVAPGIISQIGWQGWWWFVAALTLIVLVGLSLTVPKDPGPAAVGSTGAGTGGRWWQRLKRTLSSPGPWLIAVIFAMYSGQWLSVIGFLPSIYAQAGIGGALLGLLTAIVALINILGNLSAGHLLHRGIPAQRLLYTGFIIMSLGTILAFGPITADWPVLRYLAVLLFSAVGGVIPGALFSLAVRLAPDEDTISTTVGWMQQWSALGQFSGPPVVALLASLAGNWQWTWIITGVLSLVGILLARRIALHELNKTTPLPMHN